MKEKSFYEKQLDKISNNNSIKGYMYFQIRQSRAFMEDYFSDDIDLDKIAAAAFMLKFHYIRNFQKIYGVTPRQYLRGRRIAKAKELLRDGVSVTDTCFAIGYNSLSTFSRIFKKGTGLSPKEYQKVNKAI